jgi:hypothetical protein
MLKHSQIDRTLIVMIVTIIPCVLLAISYYAKHRQCIATYWQILSVLKWGLKVGLTMLSG